MHAHYFTVRMTGPSDEELNGSWRMRQSFETCGSGIGGKPQQGGGSKAISLALAALTSARKTGITADGLPHLHRRGNALGVNRLGPGDKEAAWKLLPSAKEFSAGPFHPGGPQLRWWCGESSGDIRSSTAEDGTAMLCPTERLKDTDLGRSLYNLCSGSASAAVHGGDGGTAANLRWIAAAVMAADVRQRRRGTGHGRATTAVGASAAEGRAGHVQGGADAVADDTSGAESDGEAWNLWTLSEDEDIQ